MNREQVLAELAVDVREALKTNRTQDARTAAIVALVADLLAPAAVAAIEIVGARMPMSTFNHRAGTIEYDGYGNLARVTFDEPVEIEFHERQE